MLLTPVARCNRSADWHAPVHRGLCLQSNRQIEALQNEGWYQEHYRVMGSTWEPWNIAVWDNRWELTTSQCDLCHSSDRCITAAGLSACLPCLTQYPLVPWHPTGSVRPKVTDLLSNRSPSTSPS